MEYKVKIKGLVIFELKSFIGRLFLNSKPKLNSNENYLNLGCGNNVISGYINADFFQILNKVFKTQWQLDLRYKLNCKNNIFDGIFSEHTLEHLYPSQVARLLSELYRILKPDAYIRITVPDIEKYIDFYNGNIQNIDIKEFNDKFKTGCEAIRNTTQNYFHISTWDFVELKRYLSEAGFRNIQKMKFNESNDDKLRIDKKERAWETLYVEAQK